MSEIKLPQGTIRYREDGPAEAPVVVLLHGLLVNGRLWDEVVPELSGEFRVIVPELPLGCHELPLAAGADRSPEGVARLIGDFLAALDLEDVTLVGNDTGGALAQAVAARYGDRVGRLVLTPCDAFENFLPPLFKGLQLAARVPGGLMALIQPLRLRPARNLPIAFGWLTKRRFDAERSDEFVRRFLADAGVRRDVVAFLRAISPDFTVRNAEELTRFDKPALVAWAREDKVFPLAHAERLAKLLPQGRLEWIDDARSFVPVDQPKRTASLVAAFARESQPSRAL